MFGANYTRAALWCRLCLQSAATLETDSPSKNSTGTACNHSATREVSCAELRSAYAERVREQADGERAARPTFNDLPDGAGAACDHSATQEVSRAEPRAAYAKPRADLHRTVVAGLREAYVRHGSISVERNEQQNDFSLHCIAKMYCELYASMRLFLG